MELIDEQKLSARRMLRSGRSPQAVAKKLGCEVERVIELAKRNRFPHATDSQRKKALRLLRHGDSVRLVGQSVGMSHMWVARLAKRNGITLPQSRLSSDQRLQLKEMITSGERVAVSAIRCGCCRETANVYRRQMREQGNGILFRRTVPGKSHRCPVHGLINVMPCVACAATRG